MPTSETELTVHNLILDLVAEVPLEAGGPSTAESRWLERNFNHYVEVALQANLWGFSMDLVQPDQDGSFAGNPRWKYRYRVPNTAIRIIPPTYRGQRGAPTLPYERRGGFIYCNEAASNFWVEFVFMKPNPGEWDPLFVDVVVGSLGVGMAHRFTRKASFVTIAQDMKDMALAAAEQVNAFEIGVEDVEEHDIIRARYQDVPTSYS